MNALGTHVLLELRDCDPLQLDNLTLVRDTLLEAAEEVGATILSDNFHQFSPQGVTGIIAIAESHISIHTWPEHRYAAVDIFTCGTRFHPIRAAEIIIEKLQSKDPEIVEVERGKLLVTKETAISG